jgi:hypothetical protein
MTLYQLKQYIHYRRKALGRHGLHSPFAYAFVEDVLRNCPKREVINAMVYYYNVSAVYEGDKRVDIATRQLPRQSVVRLDKLIITALDCAKKIAACAGANDVVVVRGIHNTPESTAQWDMLCGLKEVRMSIDLYGVGLLFFRKEFKVSQHFVLR